MRLLLHNVTKFQHCFLTLQLTHWNPVTTTNLQCSCAVHTSIFANTCIHLVIFKCPSQTGKLTGNAREKNFVSETCQASVHFIIEAHCLENRIFQEIDRCLNMNIAFQTLS